MSWRVARIAWLEPEAPFSSLLLIIAPLAGVHDTSARHADCRPSLALALRGTVRRCAVPESENTTVPIPSTESQAERDRIGQSNHRDQQAERSGKRSLHNEGYDEAVEGIAAPDEARPAGR